MTYSNSLIVGGDGALGTALTTGLRSRGQKVTTTSRRRSDPPEVIRLDLAHLENAESIPRGMSVAYLVAAQTSIAACEEQPKSSANINVTGTLNLARQLAREGTHIVFASTNLVLSDAHPLAHEDRDYSPQCAYAAQKAEVEQALLSLPQPASIVRLTKVTNSLIPLLSGWRDCLKAREHIHPFSDIVCAPIAEDFVVDALIKIGILRRGGVFQLSGDVDISYPEIALRLADALGVDRTMVQPIHSTASDVNIYCLPRHTTLDCTSTERSLGMRCPTTEEGIAHLVETIARNTT